MRCAPHCVAFLTTAETVVSAVSIANDHSSPCTRCGLFLVWAAGVQAFFFFVLFFFKSPPRPSLSESLFPRPANNRNFGHSLFHQDPRETLFLASFLAPPTSTFLVPSRFGLWLRSAFCSFIGSLAPIQSPRPVFLLGSFPPIPWAKSWRSRRLTLPLYASIHYSCFTLPPQFSGNGAQIESPSLSVLTRVASFRCYQDVFFSFLPPS